MNFEELQKSWRSQPIDAPEDIGATQQKLASKWQKQQRGVLWSNVFTTIGFIGFFIVGAWLYISYHEGRSIFFGGTITFMYVLLVVYLFIIWKGIAYKKNDPTVPGKEYLERSIEKLYWRRKTITTYTRVYSVLLWLALMCYGLDVSQGTSLLYKVAFFGGTTIYIFGIQALMKYTKQKKQLKQLDELIADMQQLKEKMEE